jgi:hypothetical protein
VSRKGLIVRRVVLSLTFVLCLFACAGIARAATCDTVWKGASGGNWSNAANWTAGVPTPVTNACLDHSQVAGDYTVNVDTNATVASLTVGGTSGSVTLDLSGPATPGQIMLNNGGTVTAHGAIVIGTGAAPESIDISQLGAALVNQGTITSQAASSAGPNAINGNLDNQGTLDVANSVVGGLGSWTSSGTIHVHSGQSLMLQALAGDTTAGFTLSAGTITNDGSFSQTNGSFFATGSGTVTIDPLSLSVDSINVSGTGSGTFNSAGASSILAGDVGSNYTLEESGTLTLTQARTNHGTIELDGGTLNATPGALTNAGTLTTRSGTNTFNGELVNTGTVNVNSNLNGTFSSVSTSGAINVAAGQALTLAGADPSSAFTQSAGTIANLGRVVQTNETFIADGSGTATGNPLEFAGPVTVKPSGTGSGTLHVESGSAILGSDIGHGYTVQVSGVPNATQGQLTVPASQANNGTLQLGASDGTGGTLTINNGSTFTNNGSVTFQKTGNAVDGLNGALSNHGTVTVSNNVQGTGAVANVNAMSIAAGVALNVTSFSQAAGGSLTLGVIGGNPASAAQIQTTGDITLGGTLNVQTTGAVTSPVTAIIGASRTGTFASTHFTGQQYTVGYPANGVTLTPVKTPVPGQPVPKVGSIAGGKGKVTVKLSCPIGRGACAKTTATITVVLHRSGGRVISVSARGGKSTRIGRRSVTLAAGANKTLTITVNGKGRSLLKRFRHFKAEVTVTAASRQLKSKKVALRR